MEVVDARHQNEKYFSDIEPGQGFQVSGNGRFFVKIKTTIVEERALALDTCTVIKDIDEDTLVIPCDLRVVVS